MANKSIADVFADFREDALRQKHQYDTACAQSAQLGALRGKKRRLSAEMIKDVLSGAPTDLAESELAAIEAEESALLRALGCRRFLCDLCGDKGSVGGKSCNCLLRKIYAECYGAQTAGGNNASFETLDMALFDDEQPLLGGKTQRQRVAQYAKWTQKYIDDFPDTANLNILMTGKTGQGKSFLLECMAKRAAERAIDVMLIRAGELFGLFHADRLGGEVELSYLHNAELMLIDDIGTEPVTQNVTNEYFYELIARRMEGGKHTVFVTNVEDLQKRYDERIASRLKSGKDTLWLQFDGKDLRV